MAQYRATFAEINLEAFRHNLRTIKSIVGPSAGTMAIIKADAYGHGAIPCARTAIEEGVNYLGAGIIQEGIELRKNGANCPILILGGVYSNEIEELIKHNLSASVSTSAIAHAISKEARRADKKAGIHIKVDTGMGRLGVKPEYFTSLLSDIINYKNLHIEGVFTHLACADDPESSMTLEQLKLYQSALDFFQKHSKNTPTKTNCQSASRNHVPGIFLRIW